MKKKMIAAIALLCIMVSMMSGTAFAYAEMQVTVNGIPMTLNSDYDSSIIPEGFYETDHTYQGETFYGGTDDETGTIDLYYIRCDSDPSKTGWYTLDSSGNFTKYGETSATAGLTEAQVAAAATEPTVQAGVPTGDVISGTQVTLQVYTLDSDAEVPYGYVEASVASANSMISCYRKEDASGANADSYLLYGSLDGISRGWYTYDTKDGTIQRFMGNADSQVIQQQEEIISGLKTDLSDLNDKYNKNVGRSKNLFLIAILVAVAAIFLMINAMLKRHHITMDLEDRIVDLKRNGGKETAHFSGSEMRKYERLDRAAEGRNYCYMEDDDDLDMGNPFADAPKRSKKHSKKDAPYASDSSIDLMIDDSEFDEDIAVGHSTGKRRLGEDRRDGSTRKVPVKKNSEDDFMRSSGRYGAAREDVSSRTSGGKMREDVSNRSAGEQRREKGSSSASEGRERRSSISDHAQGARTARQAAERSERSRRMNSTAARRSSREDAEATIKLPADETKRRREGVNGTRQIVDGSNTAIPSSGRKIRQKQDLTMKAAGDSADFDLDELEKNLGVMTDQVMNTPDKKSRMPRLSSEGAEDTDREYNADVFQL